MEYKHYIKMADDLIITEKFTLQDFMQTKYYNSQDLFIFFWVKDYRFIIDDYAVAVGMYFKEGLIDRVFLYLDIDSIPSEKDKISLCNMFIEKHPEYGNATADYDPRSDTTEIIINNMQE
jgi:hypothetical protein